MAEYRCPRCKGNNYFYGSRLKPDAYGGVYEGKSAICRKCNEAMDVIYSDGEEFMENLKLYGGVIIGGISLIFLFFFVLPEL
jgi:phage FluMu protein Com